MAWVSPSVSPGIVAKAGEATDPNPGRHVLDRTADIADNRAPPLAPAESQVEAEAVDEGQVRVAHHGLGRIADWWRRAWQFFITQSFSSLTRRIVFLNVTGLLALSIGIIYLSPFRAGLIDARIQSLLVQGEIIAGAIAASATDESDSSITLDPDKLQSLQPGQSYGPSRGCALRHRFSDQSRARGADPAPAGLADQDAGAHL